MRCAYTSKTLKTDKTREINKLESSCNREYPSRAKGFPSARKDPVARNPIRSKLTSSL
ncbi:hypothetical protein HanRHA438_Chr17g0807501 [Helianthus annuus]|nr:hypothetical protein HanRHA438_Chr17g0807501 [Helianthus annuus]